MILRAADYDELYENNNLPKPGESLTSWYMTKYHGWAMSRLYQGSDTSEQRKQNFTITFEEDSWIANETSRLGITLQERSQHTWISIGGEYEKTTIFNMSTFVSYSLLELIDEIRLKDLEHISKWKGVQQLPSIRKAILKARRKRRHEKANRYLLNHPCSLRTSGVVTRRDISVCTEST